MLLVALLGWWLVLEEGPTTARMIGAFAATIAAVLQFFASGRRRLFRRAPE
jgi:hypothetical protein